MAEQNNTTKKTWQQPWGYVEGFYIAWGLLIVGFAIELALGGGELNLLQYPSNFIALGTLISVIIIASQYRKKIKLIRWLSTIPAAISALSLLTLLTLLLGFTKQNDAEAPMILQNLGITHLTTSYPFAISMIYFLVTLGLVTVRRAYPINQRNIGFFINHAGLWIAIAAASFGSGDLIRLNITLNETGEFNNVGFDAYNNNYQVDIALKLIKFDIEQYNPKIVVVDNNTGLVVFEKGRGLLHVDKGVTMTMSGWNITVKEYFKSAKPKDSIYVAKDTIGCPPAAYVSVENIETKQIVEGWLSSGSFLYSRKLLLLNKDFTIYMTVPEPKRYSSLLEYYTIDKKRDTLLLEVNKPHKINQWKIYQTGYDEDMGKWSKTSVVELVSDPWINIVYFGTFMLLIGAAYIFWLGRKAKSTSSEETSVTES